MNSVARSIAAISLKFCGLLEKETHYHKIYF